MVAGLPLARILGMLAGLLILGVGIFVLSAKPRSKLHQLFFALAAADGVSTFALDLALSPVDDFLRVNSLLYYYLGFIPFVALLLVFGTRFPRPALRRPWSFVSGAALTLVAAGVWALHLADPTTVWAARRDAGALAFRPTALGNALTITFLLVIALILFRMTHVMLTEPSASHRRQGALVLGGMALGYAPVGTTLALGALARGAGPFLAPGPALPLYWAALVTTAAVVVCAASLLLDRREDRRAERNVVLACLAGVGALTAAGAVNPTAGSLQALRALGLLVWPIFLGYAIVRYEVLDIDARLRRAATISLVGAGFTAAFILFEVVIESVIQDLFSDTFVPGVLAVVLAASLTAVVSLPLAKLLRRLAQRVAPRIVPAGSLDDRRREVYRHALEGAAADGIIAPHELVVLRRLRESLSISDTEHDTMVREISARAA